MIFLKKYIIIIFMKTVLIKEDILSRNNERAGEVREEVRRRNMYYINVMSSPGAGKTTLLTGLINILKADYRIGVIEADIDSDTDALAIERDTGVKTIQMHTGGACHITCQMSYEALEALGLEGLDVVFLENIGNLVCPAEFDTGANMNLVLLSVPEGDDKPLKYPLMFRVASAVAVTKLDVAPVFDFDRDTAVKNVHFRNPSIPVFFTSAAKGEGVAALAEFLKSEINKTIQ